MQWWQLVPLALAVLSAACLLWGARQLYLYWAAWRYRERRGLHTIGRVVHVDVEDAGYDDSQQVGYPVVHFTDRAGLTREFRSRDGFQPWPEIGTEFRVWYDPDDDAVSPVLLAPASNLFAIALVVAGLVGVLAAAAMQYLTSALR